MSHYLLAFGMGCRRERKDVSLHSPEEKKQKPFLCSDGISQCSLQLFLFPIPARAWVAFSVSAGGMFGEPVVWGLLLVPGWVQSQTPKV